ncbi:paraneoplastic antigen Ma1-like [Odontesthes bonariensis]|uniref:paraneoplastic antigen Ma1-like n=1 Tax=Odontesthes bonariensis TaxID=219752 RepID=UPI003F58514B
MPEQVALNTEVAPWVVSVAAEALSMKIPPEEDFEAKLKAFLAYEGRTVADVQGLLTPSMPTPAMPAVSFPAMPMPATQNPAMPSSAMLPPASLDLNVQLVNAITSLVDKCHAAPVENPVHRKLRVFSGIKPTPPGEEEYDAWAEQMTHLLEEWKCPDPLKKQKIAECLKGPAADIVRCLRVSNPSSTANDYRAVLETAFGTTESALDFMFKLRNTFQLQGEKLSAYVLRIDKLLHSVFRKGGILLRDMDRTRIEQVARGALPNDLVALRIMLVYKFKPPPSFTELLREVRAEEALIFERPAASHVAVSATVAPVEYSTRPAAFSCPSPVPTEPVPSVESLTKEVQHLKNEMTRLLSFSVSSPSAAPPLTSQRPSQRVEARLESTPRARQDRVDVFCYKCGEDGHFARECQNAENLRKVNQRLIKLRRPTGNSPGTQ